MNTVTNRGIAILTGLILAMVWMPKHAAGQRPRGTEDAGGKHDMYAAARDELVATRIASAGVTDPRVLESMRSTPRHEFVPLADRARAYYDMSLPIGDAQTISSPFIVAMMTEAIAPQSTDRVLEIGTGSGYQAAVLSPLVADVYTIEIVADLGRTAAATLRRLKYDNVHTRIGDGFLGWPEAAPFQKIIVTCSPESIPAPLVDQLAEGGQMIIPVGERYQQTLYLLTKRDGELVRHPLRPTLFVPMTGQAEDDRKVQPDAANPVIVNGDFSEEPPELAASTTATPGASDPIAKTDTDTDTDADADAASDTGDAAPMSTLVGRQVEEYIHGWYYGRQVRRVVEDDSAGGRSATSGAFVRFENHTPDLTSHLMQGVPIDGRQVSTIRLAGSIRLQGVRPGSNSDSMPMIAISFYDQQRRDLGTHWLGPYSGNRPWRQSSKLIQVPLSTREAIVRIGLFGATGVADFDGISIKRVN